MSPQQRPSTLVLQAEDGKKCNFDESVKFLSDAKLGASFLTRMVID
jgi:hypothetical protein